MVLILSRLIVSIIASIDLTPSVNRLLIYFIKENGSKIVRLFLANLLKRDGFLVLSKPFHLRDAISIDKLPDDQQHYFKRL